MVEQAQTVTSTGARKRLLREYETVFTMAPELSDDVVDKLKDRLRAVVTREGGKVLKFTNWGKKKTAFPVAKQVRAIYVHMSYLAGPTSVAEVERNLRNTEEVAKFISTRVADDIDPDTRAIEPDVKLAGDVDEKPKEMEREGMDHGNDFDPDLDDIPKL
jgi:small subunit ribosomal protein S6